MPYPTMNWPTEPRKKRNGSIIHWDRAFRLPNSIYRVPVTCGSCHQKRLIDATRTRGKYGKVFTGYCYSCNLRIQRKSYKPGWKHPDWRGGHFINGGYAYINIRSLIGKTKKLALQMSRIVHGKPAIVAEHRLVMALHLGRPLKSSEVIHHRDGNKLNNEISNLELTDHANHRKLDTKYYRLWKETQKRVAELELELLRYKGKTD